VISHFCIQISGDSIVIIVTAVNGDAGEQGVRELFAALISHTVSVAQKDASPDLYMKRVMATVAVQNALVSKRLVLVRSPTSDQDELKPGGDTAKQLEAAFDTAIPTALERPGVVYDDAMQLMLQRMLANQKTKVDRALAVLWHEIEQAIKKFVGTAGQSKSQTLITKKDALKGELLKPQNATPISQVKATLQTFQLGQEPACKVPAAAAAAGAASAGGASSASYENVVAALNSLMVASSLEDFSVTVDFKAQNQQPSLQALVDAWTQQNSSVIDAKIEAWEKEEQLTEHLKKAEDEKARQNEEKATSNYIGLATVGIRELVAPVAIIVAQNTTQREQPTQTRGNSSNERRLPLSNPTNPRPLRTSAPPPPALERVQSAGAPAAQPAPAAAAPSAAAAPAATPSSKPASESSLLKRASSMAPPADPGSVSTSGLRFRSGEAASGSLRAHLERLAPESQRKLRSSQLGDGAAAAPMTIDQMTSWSGGCDHAGYSDSQGFFGGAASGSQRSASRAAIGSGHGDASVGPGWNGMTHITGSNGNSHGQMAPVRMQDVHMWARQNHPSHLAGSSAQGRTGSESHSKRLRQ
jgi:hypothetical protein